MIVNSLTRMISSIKVQTKPVSSAVDAGAQIQQLINIEVNKPFFEPPLLEVKLTLVIHAMIMLCYLLKMIHFMANIVFPIHVCIGYCNIHVLYM